MLFGLPQRAGRSLRSSYCQFFRYPFGCPTCFRLLNKNYVPGVRHAFTINMVKEFIQQSFQVTYDYRVHFTRELFAATNPLLRLFVMAHSSGITAKALVVVDEGVARYHRHLPAQISTCFESMDSVSLVGGPMVVSGGEAAKNTSDVVDRIIAAVDHYGIDRHSYVFAIGGGAVLDAVGYAAAIAHR